MSKVFRLYTGGTDTYQDWNSAVTFPYDANARKTINDPEGANAKNEITSIPSPFARIDLVKMAFAEVYRSGNLDGNTIFHKMVSDALDVGEIFFNYSKFSDKIEIITWECATEIQNLIDSNSNGHQYYGDALNKYLDSDGATYNFDKLENVYLLNYKNGPAPLNIIGATSPATLFFSTANDLSYVDDIFFAHDKPFDSEFQPLYNRADKEYIKSWFLLRNTIDNFAQLFPEVDDYLDLTYKAIADNNLRQELKNMSAVKANGFGTITITTAALTNTVEVLGYNLFQKKSEVESSGFEIKSSIFNGPKMPFVLPVEAGNKYANVDYTTGKWGNTNHAPYYDNNPDINSRKLPFDGSSHPYLTIGDFLEDNIIRIPHSLNKEAFFDGNAGLSKPQLSYLLPLKRTFFDFFSADELISGLNTGEKMIEMQLLGEVSIKVTIRIPIIGDGRNVSFMEYSRIYYGENNKADIDNNRGGIVEFDFAGFVMPGIRFNISADALYTVCCVSSFNSRYEMDFYNHKGKLHNIICDCRNKYDSKHMKAESYTIEKEIFDYIQITSKQQGYSGVIVPQFKQQVYNDDLLFAVDLGTSNTHIEYIKKQENISHDFGFSESDSLLCKMFIPSLLNGTTVNADLDEEEELMEKDFLPAVVGATCDFNFPTRTVLSYAKQTDWQRTTKPFGLINIPLTYNKREWLNHNADPATDIKWGRDDRRKMEAYIDCLMVMLRNKVIMEGGNLSGTKITWFYPLSMAPRRLNMLKDTWNEAFRKYFGSGTTYSITESEAPILYYFNHYAEATNLVNIDIGGGTTDIAFAKDRKIEYVTSFKFASNALFEDSLANDNTHNGIIDHYKPIFKEIMEGQKLSELTNIFEKNENRPSDMAMFLFSLSKNTLANNLNKNDIDFTAKLREDDDFKIVFILFYAAIIWHVAQIVKLKGMEVPRHITFSGNGSKVLSIITTNFTELATMTKIIFELVLGRPYNNELDILGLSASDSNPKKSTCKGGLLSTGTNDVGRDKIIILKSDASGVVTDEDTYNTLDDVYINRAAEGVDEFFDVILNKLSKKFNFDDHFGLSNNSLETAKAVCKKDIKTFIKKGKALMVDEADGDSRIDETLFFYPVKGVLQALSKEINAKL